MKLLHKDNFYVQLNESYAILKYQEIPSVLFSYRYSKTIWKGNWW